MYPIKFKPILKERLWGGTKLKTLFNKPIETDITGESWEVSAVKGDISVVANGEFKDKSLQELIDLYPNELLGKHVYERFGTDFPILIKFIDAREDLSIQVHPNDDLAKKRHNSFGKTEMWYVMQADPGAKLIVGFNKDVTKEEYQKHLTEGTLTDIMNYEEVSEGDTFFINTGKVHAIGGGIIIAEIQQTSDITYRVYDFNRKDKNGNLRELHTELALEAIDYQKKDDFKVSYSKSENTTNKMVDCPYFITHYLSLSEDFEKKIGAEDSFHIYMCVKGSGIVSDGKTELSINQGETVLFPAVCDTLQVKTSGIELLEVSL
ncbi:Mannose-6-phosphate isomerase, class I [Capnocytophaga canis]|uniref:Phosphohexomutase n=1 Tax=Capnocytophaga canis TaxID=1848903 RepID=A0A0B7I746_9FLAO|nr:MULTISPECIES: type I phosphomannose isomerase catalytic subunit [Capnocytophaga]ATA72477.1 mannose-6-phosphate isomerase [Capnocytophaga sp. H4358]ATA74588.1 mannose-6-phosphate isomerase [Capnocytophaga sp. H2931]CEN45892.1 Mannose-6-phosphate isomerase, class I [Capnocytophaga canis]CEN46195.1 Mannose-6-phosphate isomerase, class I [Capnocytophaga canis]GIM62151.1 mannose-6-phosphate isomerase [Capnocytophaga canis]